MYWSDESLVLGTGCGGTSGHSESATFGSPLSGTSQHPRRPTVSVESVMRSLDEGGGPKGVGVSEVEGEGLPCRTPVVESLEPVLP